MSMENSQAILADRVGHVVAELSELGFDWLDLGVEGGSNRCILIIHPIAIMSRASCAIANKDIVWMGDPEATRCRVGVQEREGRLSSCYDVILD